MDLQLLLEIIGLFLTLIVLFYLVVGDNALFRMVTYTFVGVASAFILVLVIFQVLLPRLSQLMQSNDLVYFGLGLIPFGLGFLLLFKLSPRFSSLGTLPLAILVGVGAAVTVGGAVFGTLAGQIFGTMRLFNPRTGGDLWLNLLEGSFVLLGAVSTLIYFQFSMRKKPAAVEKVEGTRRTPVLEFLAKVGQVFIGITLGAVFAGVYAASLSALIERIDSVIGIVMKFF